MGYDATLPELKASHRTLKQDTLLRGVAEAARRLLAIADFDMAVNGALEAIAIAADVDRIYIYQHHKDPSTQQTTATCPYEWTKPNIIKGSSIPGRFPTELDIFGDWLSRIEAGAAVQGLTRHLSNSAQILQKLDAALSLLVVPIIHDGECWGSIGFDDCTTERIWSEAEISVLETATASFAGALQRQRDEVELKRRDALLNGVNAAAQCLVATDDLARAIPEALQILGERTRQDRVYVFENVFPQGPDEVFWEIPYEWCKKGVPTSAQVSSNEWPIAMSSFPSEILKPFWDGQVVQFLTSELEGQARIVNEESRTLALITVPILVSGQWWGVLGFDDCSTERVWSDAEIAVLETAAACIGSAVERDRARKEREAATQARTAQLEAHNQALAGRDRILTAIANASNILQAESNFDHAVNTVIRILGESIGCDRAVVGQQFDDPTGETLGFLRILYEWDSPGISSQTRDYEGLQDISWDDWGIAAWFHRNLQGEAFGATTDDFSEHFRQLQDTVGTQAVHNIPIFVEGQFWGVVGTDHCQEKKLLTEAELAAFKTAANCIGNAIERDRAFKEREAAAQARAAELETHNQTLAERDRILEATAAAANVMLTEEVFESAVNRALQLVGVGLDVDRILLGQYFEPRPAQEFGFFQFVYEWVASNTSLQSEHPQLSKISDEGIENIVDHLRVGEILGGIIDELPEPFRSGQIELGVQSTYAIPIRVEGEFWGVIALDDCSHSTRRSDAELEALRTLANCIGSAIERDRDRKEREAAARARLSELAERDRILEATAAAANIMLTADDFNHAVNSALRIVGEGLGVDRINLGQYFEPTSQPECGYHVFGGYEWVSSNTSLQSHHPKLSKISDAGIELPIKALRRGEVFGGIVQEMLEPFRSSQLELGVKSTYAIPILVDGRYWGMIGLDDCHQLTRRSEAELEALMTLANCIGSAIEREQLRQAELQAQAARTAAERDVLLERDRSAQERARLLSCVAEVANLLLRSADYTNVLSEVVRLLGEAVECDRCEIGWEVTQPNLNKPAVSTAEWEWHRRGTTPSKNFSPHSAPFFFWEDAPYIAAKLRKGEVVSTLVEDLPEPDRSLMVAQGNTAECFVPITVQQQLWGYIAFDNCSEPRLYDEAEISILRVAAESIAAAIARQVQEEALRESNRRFKELLEASNDHIQFVEFDPPLPINLPIEEQIDRIYRTSQFVEINPAGERDLGMSRADIIGKPLSIMHSPNDPGHRNLMRQLIKNNWQITNAESEDIAPDGNRRYWLSHLFATEEDGCIVRAWGVVNNITSLKKAQLARKDAEKVVLEEREKAAQQRAAELVKANEAISQTLNTLASKPQLSEFLGQLLLAIAHQIGSHRIHLFLYDEATHTLSLHTNIEDGLVYAGASPNDIEFFHRPIPADIGPAWRLISESEDILMHDLQSPLPDEYWWPGTQAWHQAQGHVSWACIPMRAGQQKLGFIGFAFRDRTVLTDEQLGFMQALTNQAIVAIQLTRLAEDAKQTAIFQERERAAQERSAELAKANRVLKTTIDTLMTEPDISRFLGYVLQEIALQFDSPFLEYWRNEQDDVASLEIIVINGEILTGEQLAEHHGFQGLIVPPDAIDADTLFQRSQHTQYTISSTNRFVGPFYDNLNDWCQTRGVDLPGTALNFPVVLGETCFGAIAIFLPSDRVLPEETIELGYALTNQAALALQLTQLAEDAKHAAILRAQEKATQERAAQLAKTNEEIANSLTKLAANPEIDQFLGTIIAEMAKQVNACKVHLFLYDEPSHTLIQRIAVQNGQVYFGAGPHDPDMFSHPIPVDMTGGWNIIITSERPLTYDATLPYEEDIWWPDSLMWHKEQGHQAITCLPMKAGETPIGFIGFCFYDRTVLSDEQLEFMQTLANQAIVAIQIARLAEEAKQTAIAQEQEKAAQERAAQLIRSNQALKRNLDSLAQQPELDAFLQRVVDEATVQTGAASGHLFLSDEASNISWLQVSTDNNGDWRVLPDMKLWLQPIDLDQAPGFWELIYKKKPVIVEDLQHTLKPSPYIWEPSIAWHLKRNHSSVICAPLVLGDRVLGFLGLPFVDRTLISQDNVELAQALANQATLAIQLTRLAEQARTNALTDERNRLAREIHDTLAQAFTGVSLQLEVVRGLTHQPANAEEALATSQTHIRRARDLARQGLSEARRSVHALRSEALEADDLPNALSKMLNRTQHDSGLSTHFSLEGAPISLPDDIQLNLLRIAQEAITNTLRHANATQLEITLSFRHQTSFPQSSHEVQLRILDNGIGFDPAILLDKPGFGMIGIRERATRFYGTFDLQSTPGIGTVLTILIPLQLSLH